MAETLQAGKQKACKHIGCDYEHAGREVHVICELPRGHAGNHAAWTWDTAPYPRVEWDDTGTALTLLAPKGRSGHE